MMASYDFVYNLGAFVVSALLAIFATLPVSMRLAHRAGAIDLPGDLKVHQQPIPRLGGVGIVMALLIAFGGGALIRGTSPEGEILAVAGGALAMAVLGVIDDVRDLSQTLKFAIESLVALVVVLLLANSLGITWWLAAVAWLTLVGLTNAYNFIDGLDGLAGGIATINLGVLAVLFILKGQFLPSLLAAVSAGSCLGFLRFNWHPARLFMGDVGALSIGFLIAGLSLLYAGGGGWDWSRLVAVGLAAALPAGDLVLTFIRRLVRRQSFLPQDLFPGDRFHFYDQMQAHVGLSTVSTVKICYRVSLILAVAGTVAAQLPPLWAMLFGLLNVILLILLAMRYQIGMPKLERTQI